MKYTLALVLIIFGLVGCATNSDRGYTMVDGVKYLDRNHPNFAANIETNYTLLRLPKAEARAVNSLTVGDGFYHDGGKSFSGQSEINKHVLSECEKVTSQRCLIAREGDKNVWVENKMAFHNSPGMIEISRKVREERLAQEKREMYVDDMTQRDITRQDVKGKIGYCNAMYSSNQQLRNTCLNQIGFIEPSIRAEIAKQDASRNQERKKKILTDLKQRCDGYGFTGESNISACIQREAQHDKELAMQKYELEKTRLALQQAQARTYAQNVTEPVPEEEDLPFLIKFLGDVAMGVAEAYADPAFHRDVQQQKQINQLKANQRRCVHNC